MEENREKGGEGWKLGEEAKMEEKKLGVKGRIVQIRGGNKFLADR